MFKRRLYTAYKECSRVFSREEQSIKDEALSALKSRNILLHPQMLSDAMTVIGFSRIYRPHCNARRPIPTNTIR